MRSRAETIEAENSTRPECDRNAARRERENVRLLVSNPPSSSAAPRPLPEVDTGAENSRSRYEAVLEAVDIRALSLMRLILALSALLLVIVSPQEFTLTDLLGQVVLFFHCAYSLTVYAIARRGESWVQSRALHWVDMGWYVVLIALTGVTNSALFSFFFFIILAASFRWGFIEGLRVTLASAICYCAMALASMAYDSQLELQQLLLRPVYLVVLGYLIARWGDSEILQKHRLSLLNELTRMPNPRLGIDQALGLILERLRRAYQADTCLVVMADVESSSYVMHLADPGKGNGMLLGERIAPETACPLLALPAHCGAVYCSAGWRLSGKPYWYVNSEEVTDAEPGVEHGSAIASLLDAQSFVSVPIERANKATGRLYLTAKRSTFASSDVHFLRQLIDQVTRVIDNTVFLDRIASDAAGHERQKISRDLHDSTIQPYVGLKLGLEALRRKMNAGDPLAREIDDLCTMTNEGIAELRRYVGGLRATRDAQAEFLIEAVWRQAEKFEEFYGIEVEVNSRPDLGISDRLAAEVLHIVNEGLSNIRRHTQSTRATLNLRRQQHNVIIQIINHGGSLCKAFTPRSITERANHLGGNVEVTQLGDGSTAVTVNIPL